MCDGLKAKGQIPSSDARLWAGLDGRGIPDLRAKNGGHEVTAWTKCYKATEAFATPEHGGKNQYTDKIIKKHTNPPLKENYLPIRALKL